MGLFYQYIVRPVLFTQDPEKSHVTAVKLLRQLSKSKSLCRILGYCNRPIGHNPIDLFGLKFPTAVGLAAGMDKNGQFWRAAEAMGFGHVEIGTVTPLAQNGNPQPRLFRHPEHQAITNKMGFNNDGAEAIARRLKESGAKSKKHLPLGINIGKNKDTHLENALDDYLKCFNNLADYANYFTINISSPNTPGLRLLHETKNLCPLLRGLREININRSKKLGVNTIPMLLKISPDLSFRELDSVIESVLQNSFDGVIATNTTISREGGLRKISQDEGGLSGRPLHEKSITIINYINRVTNGKLPIIGVGGISDPITAGKTCDAGAKLIQIYSGLIYKGPFLAKKLSRALAPRHSKWL